MASVPAFAGAGCEHCRHTGYGGRVPIAELLTPSDELREAIVGGAAARDIRAAMRASGMPTMRDQAMRFVSQGLTSLHEVHRVLSDEVDGEPPAHIQSRVLIADDEPVARMIVRRLLERENFRVLEAANGKQPVDVAMRERSDLMIIDLNMPEMDGYEAIARLRRDITVAATLPIMVLTSEEGPAVESRVLELGADDYIVKPFDPTVLLVGQRGLQPPWKLRRRGADEPCHLLRCAHDHAPPVQWGMAQLQSTHQLGECGQSLANKKGYGQQHECPTLPRYRRPGGDHERSAKPAVVRTGRRAPHHARHATTVVSTACLQLDRPRSRVAAA